MAKITTPEFIKKAQEKYGFIFNYDKVNYVNFRKKVIITCKTHGDFEITPENHLNGHICVDCSGNKKLTAKKIIEKSKITHGDKYDYSNLNFSPNKKKITIICKTHGDFEQNIYNHINGSNCPDCVNENRRLTTEEFIEKSILIHGNEYDYSKVKYINATKKVIIICKIHGEFLQNPGSHLEGSRCADCYGTKNYSIDDFINDAIKKHGYKYDYSKVNYVNCKTKIEIICPTHGSFLQVPNSHVRFGCQECAYSKLRMTTEEFKTKAGERHNHIYDYTYVEYKGCNDKIKINCLMHGIFLSNPSDHLKGIGCPACSHSKGELKIREILENKNIEFTPQKRFPDCKDIKPLVFDFYVPNLNLCIEFDGKQHFENIEYFGGEKAFKLTQKRDEIKNNYCRDNNIKLLRIRYDQDIIEILDKELNG